LGMIEDGMTEWCVQPRNNRVVLDKNEGVVKAQNALAVFLPPRGCQRRRRTKTLEISR